MNLDNALSALAAFLKLDAAELHEYARADNLGGWHPDEAQRQFAVGSLFAVEGQALYALVRALRPARVLELGVNHGASTTHLMSALHTNGSGKLTSVDIWGGAGYAIPDSLKPLVNLVYADALEAIAALDDNSVDFVFEDLLHGDEQTRLIIEALQPKLTPGAVVVHHDSEHGDDGVKVRAGIATAGISDYVSVLIEPSDCGLAVWQADGERGEVVAEVEPEPEPTPAPKPPAKKRVRKPAAKKPVARK